MTLPASYQLLIRAFDALPGIGPRAAARLAEHALLNEDGQVLADAIVTARRSLRLCQRCCCLTASDLCDDCHQSAGNQPLFVVADISAWQQMKEQGKPAFVLHGLLSPAAGIGPRSLKLSQLRDLVLTENTQRLVLAFPAGVEADATEVFIRSMLAGSNVSIERDKAESFGGEQHG